MAKLRHLAIQVTELPPTVTFFQEVFEMKTTYELHGEWGGVVYLTDGTIALAVLAYKDPEKARKSPMGLNHIGFVVRELRKTVQTAEALGGVTVVTGDKLVPGELWEYKMKTPDGILFDLYDVQGRGWPGISGLEDLGVPGEVGVESHRACQALAGGPATTGARDWE